MQLKPEALNALKLPIAKLDFRDLHFMAPLISGCATLAASSMNTTKKGLATPIRYSLSRRAFSLKPNEPEVLLLDYPSHERRLLPLIAKTNYTYLNGLKANNNSQGLKLWLILEINTRFFFPHFFYSTASTLLLPTASSLHHHRQRRTTAGRHLVLLLCHLVPAQQDSSKEMAEKKIRINWKQEGVDKTFLESCIHEVALHGREGSSLKAISWRKVAEKLKTEHEFIVDQKQMKNRYDYLKSKFVAWLKLKNKTGNVYNPLTNTFNLTEEEWQLEIKSNKFVEKLRRAPLDYPDLCIQLFEGSTSNGFDSWGPSSTLPHPSVDVIGQKALLDIDGTQMEHGASEESSDRSKHKRKAPTQGVSNEPSYRSKKGKQTLSSHLIEVGEVLHMIHVF